MVYKERPPPKKKKKKAEASALEASKEMPDVRPAARDEFLDVRATATDIFCLR